MTITLLTIEQVCKLTSLGRTTIYEAMKQGIFPLNFKLIKGGRAARWNLSDIDAYLTNRSQDLTTNNDRQNAG